MKYIKIISSLFFKSLGANRLVKSVKVLPVSIKTKNPTQKHPHIIESYACILKMFAKAIDISINVSMFFGKSKTQKLSK